MRRCVIVGGAGIGNYDRIRQYLRQDDYFVFCDAGLKHREPLGAEPDLVIGDFDSHPKPETDKEVIVLPHVKDDTDTRYAADEALRRGFSDFLLLGVIGERFDHSLGNISILQMLFDRKAKALLLDDYSEMEIVGSERKTVAGAFSYFSLLNVSGTAKKIEIRNALYPLRDAEIRVDYQYGVSNEVLPGKTAEVKVGEGSALLIRVF